MFATSSPIISATKLTFGFAKGQHVLEDLTFALPQGSLTCLAGRNGSGKSTLLGLLAGLFAPTGGQLTVAGWDNPGGAKQLRGAVRLVLQEAELQCLGATVGEDLLLGQGDADPTLFAEQARDMAARLHLTAQWDQPVHTLSHGQKRKCAIAGALLAAPSILLLDEPTSGLDHPAILELRDILQANQAAGITQVVATHDLEPLIDLCQGVLALREGRLVCHAPPGEAMQSLIELGMRPPCSWRTSGLLAPYR